MRGAAGLLTVLALSGCAGSPAPAAERVATAPASCPATPGRTDHFKTTPATSGWELVSVEDTPGTWLSDGTVTPDGTLWALRHTPADAYEPRRWDGRRWDGPAAPPGSGRVRALAAVSADRAWTLASTDDGGARISSWNGRAWRTEPLDTGDEPSPDLHAQGGWITVGSRSLRWDGSRWQSIALPAYARQLSASGDVPWVIGVPDVLHPDAAPVAARWTGTAWQVVDLPGPTLPPDADGSHGRPKSHLYSVVRTSEDEWWALGGFSWTEREHEDEEIVSPGRAVALRLSGTTWTCLLSADSRNGGPKSLVAGVSDGEGGLWAVTTDSTLWHLSKDRWTRERVPGVRGGRAFVDDLVTSAKTGEVYALGEISNEKGQPYSETSRAALWHCPDEIVFARATSSTLLGLPVTIAA